MSVIFFVQQSENFHGKKQALQLCNETNLSSLRGSISRCCCRDIGHISSVFASLSKLVQNDHRGIDTSAIGDFWSSNVVIIAHVPFTLLFLRRGCLFLSSQDTLYIY